MSDAYELPPLSQIGSRRFLAIRQEIEQLGGEYHVANVGEMRHVLNEYRSLIRNDRDSIHYN